MTSKLFITLNVRKKLLHEVIKTGLSPWLEGPNFYQQQPDWMRNITCAIRWNWIWRCQTSLGIVHASQSRFAWCSFWGNGDVPLSKQASRTAIPSCTLVSGVPEHMQREWATKMFLDLAGCSWGNLTTKAAPLWIRIADDLRCRGQVVVVLISISLRWSIKSPRQG